MLKPQFLSRRKFVAFYNQCTVSSCPVTSSKYPDYWTSFTTKNKTSETMSPKRSKKALSDSESASSASDSESSTPPRKDAKKAKKEEESTSKPSKPEGKSDNIKGKSDSLRVHGEAVPTWELGGKKFVKVDEFKGKTYVSIREYYEKDGKVLPGKKGISLTAEQWKNFCSSIDEVNQILKK